jgi:hypothetical protein
MKSYAYVIEDKSIDENGAVRNKSYVGKSNNPQRRFKDHVKLALSGVDSVFYRAIRAHGIENFFIAQVYECESEDDAFEKEKSLILELKSYVGFEDCKGYNSTLGGDGFDSETASINAKKSWEENYEKRKLANKVRWEKNPQEKEKHSEILKKALSTEQSKIVKHNVMLERWKDEEYRLHMSNKHRNRWNDEGFREKTVSSIKEAKARPDVKEKTIARNKKVWESLSDEEKQKTILRLNEARKKKLLQKSKKEKILKEKNKSGPTSEKSKETWSNLEIKNERIKKMKEAWADPEKKAKRLKRLKETREKRKMKEPLLADIVHQADIISTKQEKE